MGTTGERRIAVAMAILLATAAFSWSYANARRLDDRGVFDKHNILFDADPIAQIRSLSEGQNKHGRSIHHPNFSNYLNPLVRAAAGIAAIAGGGETDERALRREIALLVSPLLGALATVVVFATFRRLGFPLLPSAIGAALGTVSFSRTVFGSIPDHWMASGFAIALACLLAAERAVRPERPRWVAWIAVTALATGVTITNFFAVALLLWVPMALGGRLGRRERIRGSAVLLAGALAVVVVAAAGRVAYPDAKTESARYFRVWVRKNFNEDPLAKLARAPTAAANALAPPRAATILNWTGIRYGRANFHQFSLEGSANALSGANPLGLLVLLVLGAGAVRGLRADPPLRSLVAASLAVLAYNLVLHSFWGAELFLYSQHYEVPLVVATSGVMAGRGKARVVGTAVAALLVVLVAHNSVERMDAMLATIDGWPR